MENKNYKNLTIEDLSFHRHGHSISRGFRNYQGRIIKDSAFIEEYKTKIGNFSQEEWYELALKTVRETGEYELYLKIVEHCKKHCAWLHKEREISEYALSCMTDRAYKSWGDFEE